MSGYTLSYRDKWTHPAFRNLREVGMWSWMCDTAAWKNTKIRFNGNMVDLERGQLATSIRFMSKGFEIGEQATRRFLENLEKEGMINTRPTHYGTIITVCNYDKYQDFEKTDNTPTNTRPTHAQHTPNTNKNTINTGNTINKDYYAFSDDVLQAWRKAYPLVDIEAEIRKAIAWEKSNPGKQKKDKKRFMNNWLSNAKPSPAKPKDTSDNMRLQKELMGIS